MKTYQDKYTRWHHKETALGEHSSNNGWIYSAYSKYLAPDTLDETKLNECFDKCNRSVDYLKVDRSPGDPYPPFSKDEVVGSVSLGLIHLEELRGSYWNFCNLVYESKKLTLSVIYKAYKEFKNIDTKIKELDLQGGDKRNYMWQHNRTDAYSLGFWLQPWDQYYVMKMSDERPTLFQTLCFYINFLTTFYKGNKSVKMMLWLQCEDMKHWLLRFIPRNEWVRAYFDENHPFVQNLENK